MPSLLAIADDLTGATDVAVQLADTGATVEVHLWPDRHMGSTCSAEILVANSESRHCAPAEAAQRVRSLVEQGIAMGIRNFYKKTDSTLRGNIGAELEAALRVTEVVALPFVPASPALGRTTSGGLHYVHGRLLHETEYGTDPLNPVKTSNVRDLLQQQTSIAVVAANEPKAPLQRLAILVHDCESVRDYEEIARHIRARQQLRLCAGPAAFIRALQPHYDLPTRSISRPELQEPVLIINGSLNPLALEQLKQLPITPVLIPARTLLQADVAGFKCEFASGTLAVTAARTAADYTTCAALAEQQGLRREELHARVARTIGCVARQLLERGGFRTLVVVGGDTLAGVAHACGWERFIALGEAVAGVAAVREPQSGLLVLTKPGGFGAPATLRELLAQAR
ncbi:MAG TPA: four-carbon acid sugar kinase family protein [Methylomirabilota bacterium]|nr:four-carbon acid sugar kinase family protein [Methylomirabilota bacterium]